MTNIFRTIVFVMIVGFPMTVLAESGDGQQGGHNHKMPSNMKTEMMSGMTHDMTTMMGNMEEMHFRMKKVMEKMDRSAQKAEMIELHQDMTQVMEKMKMTRKNMKHKMLGTEAKTKTNLEKKEHSHNH